MPLLAPTLGLNAFDVGDDAPWFTPFLQSGTPLADSLAGSWHTLQIEVRDSPGPLSVPAHIAGRGVAKLQRAITAQREARRFQELDVFVRSLAPDDMRHAAWVNLDRFSTTWVTAWPCRDAYLSNAEFMEVSSWYFGLPSPACSPRAGERIGNTRLVLDRYGSLLTTAHLPGDGWRTQHDSLKWRLWRSWR